MAKEEWGTKRICPTTGKRFYDMNRDPIVSPYTGEVVVLDTSKTGRMMVADKPDRDAKKEAPEDEDAVLEEEDTELDDTDDEVLDEDSDDVSLDDIADVSDDNGNED